MKAAKCN